MKTLLKSLIPVALCTLPLFFMSFRDSETLRVMRMKTYSDSLNLSAHKGKVVVLNFWASWSKLSRTENKNIVRLYEKHRQHPRLAFISVSLDTDDKVWKTAIEEDEMAWKDHVCDYKKYSSPIALKYGIKSIPQIIVIDKDGNVAKSSARMSDIESAIDEMIK